MTSRTVKITAAQIIALRSATLMDDGMYELTTAKTPTLNALVRLGVVVAGSRLLTVQGVSVMHTVSHVDVIPSKGHSVYVSDAPESLATFTLAPVSEGVKDDVTDTRGDAENGAQSDDSDAGFVETLVTKEYLLSVTVDETTGASVSLGWVTLIMNAAQCMDFDRVAEEYGRVHGTGTPRHGWASIITVHDVADQF